MKRTVATGMLLAFALAGRAGAAAGVDDRLTLMVSGATLTDADDGGGASIGWLHNFNADAILGVRGEYQTIADSDWQFGALSGAYGFGEAGRRTNLYGEVSRGSGEDTNGSFDYSIATAGLIQNVTRQVGIQLEDKYIDIDTSHGNLPRLGVQVLWSQTLLTNVSYAHSVSGNLGTRLWSARIDRYGKTVNLILGGAAGKASPAVIDLQTGDETPGANLKEGFIGITKPFARADLTLLGDYVKIADTERITVTLNCMVRLRGAAQ